MRWSSSGIHSLIIVLSPQHLSSIILSTFYIQWSCLCILHFSYINGYERKTARNGAICMSIMCISNISIERYYTLRQLGFRYLEVNPQFTSINYSHAFGVNMLHLDSISCMHRVCTYILYTNMFTAQLIMLYVGMLNCNAYNMSPLMYVCQHYTLYVRMRFDTTYIHYILYLHFVFKA